MKTIERKDLTDINGDVSNLAHLLDEITVKVVGLETDSTTEHGKDLNRIGALLWIARDLAEQLERQTGGTGC